MSLWQPEYSAGDSLGSEYRMSCVPAGQPVHDQRFRVSVLGSSAVVHAANLSDLYRESDLE